MKLDIPNTSNIETTVKKIKSGELSALELVTEHLELAKKVDKELNAFITILDEAVEKAKEIDKKILNGEEAGKLAGIPFTTKDLYLVDGVKTTFGSKITEDFVAPYTATVVQKLLDEDAVLIGKCNCDPWGFGGSGENSGYDPTKNPYDLSKVPGGSSSGSAASMAAGVGFFSLGTDTGGSVRQPASFCGLYGLKPTYGRNSRYGIGTMGSSFDTPGFFARHIEDIELLEEIMEGEDEYDPTTSRSKSKEQRSKISTTKTLGVPKEYFGEGLNEEVKNAIDNQINELKNRGFEIKEVSIPSTKYALAVYYVLVPSEISSNRARYDGVRYGKKVSDEYEENMIESRSRYLEDEVKRRIMIGTYNLSAGYGDQFYKKASIVRSKLKNEFKKVFEEVDLLIAPVAPTTAFALGEKTSDPLEMYLTDIYTVTANIVGIPSLAVPIGSDSNNLPIGMQVMGSWFEEEKIFRLFS